MKIEEFLEEYNKLSPSVLKADIKLLSQFKEERPSLFNGDNWVMDKIRKPFVMWLTSLTFEETNSQDIKHKQRC